MNSLIDNREVELAQKFKELANNIDTIKIVTGYFYLSGFNLVKDQLKGKKVRIIMGDQTDPITQNEIKLGYEKRALYKFNQDIERMDDNDGQLLKSLSDLIGCGDIEIKVYKDDDKKLHAKAYIFSSDEDVRLRSLIIGSSNFTRSGMIKGGNIELNSVVTHAGDFQMITKWFDEIWESSDEFNDEILRIIKTSVPYQHHVENDLEYISPVDLFKMMSNEYLDGYTKPSEGILAEFQELGVINAQDRIKQLNGCILADSVGLGKTLIALKLIECAQSEGKNALVIVPKNLEANWCAEIEKVKEKFNLKTDEKKLKILSMNKLSTYNISNISDKSELIKLGTEYKFLVIDEAHRFRNHGEYIEKEYSNNKNYANLTFMLKQSKDIPIQCLLLTATPLNNSIQDIYNLLRIFTNEIALKNYNTALDMRNFDEYKRLTLKEKEAKKEGLPANEFTIEKKKHLAGIRKILEEVMILRTRSYISSKYGDLRIGGKPVTFQLPTVSKQRYVFPTEYDALYDNLEELLGKLTVPHMSILRNRKNAQLGGLFKVLLLKRLESSIDSFVISLKNLHKRESDLLDEIKSMGWDHVMKTKFINKSKTDNLLDDEELTELIDEFNDDKNDVFNKEEFENKLNNDLKYIQDFLSNSIVPIQQDDGYVDPKLDALLDILRNNLGNKILIFTQYHDTLLYLEKKLRVYSLSEDIVIDYVSGSINDGPVGSNLDKEKKIKLFAPCANNYSIDENENEIQILVSTDALSEGVNLQDSSIIINYDLPWNPMRLVQRIGRVDRIGSTGQTLVYNILPDENLDKFLKLLNILLVKIENVSSVIGKEYQILSETEDTNPREIGEKITNTMKEIRSTTSITELENTAISHELDNLIPNAIFEKRMALKLRLKEMGITIDNKINYPNTPKYSILKNNLNTGIFMMFRLYDNRLMKKINNIILLSDFKGKHIRELDIDTLIIDPYDIDRKMKNELNISSNDLVEIKNKIQHHLKESYVKTLQESFDTFHNTPTVKPTRLQKVILSRLKKIQSGFSVEKNIEELEKIFQEDILRQGGKEVLYNIYNIDKTSLLIKEIENETQSKFIQNMKKFSDIFTKNNIQLPKRRVPSDIKYKLICWGVCI